MDTFAAAAPLSCSHPADPGRRVADPRSPRCLRTRLDAAATASCHVDPAPEARSARWPY